MNQVQRNTLKKAIAEFTLLTDVNLLKTITIEDFQTRHNNFEEDVTTIAEEEREKYDNMSEGLQASATGERIGEIADALENIAFGIDFDPEEARDDDWYENIAQQVQDIIDEVEEAAGV